MSVRKFWVVNGNDEKYELTNASVLPLKVNLSNPNGLGFVNKIETLRLGNRRKVLNKQYDLPKVNGIVNFYGTKEEAYEQYNQFVLFLSKQPLKLFQQTPNTINAFYIDCVVSQLDKGEMNSNGNMPCNISFDGLTFWKNGNKNVQLFERDSGRDGKYYQLERPYHYGGSGFVDMPIINNNTTTSPFIFEITGRVINPVLSFYQNDVKYGVIKLIGTFDYIKVNTEASNQELYLERDRLPLSNPMNYQDTSYFDGTSDLTFFDLLAGNNLLTFNADNENEFDGELKMTWEDEFISV